MLIYKFIMENYLQVAKKLWKDGKLFTVSSVNCLLSNDGMWNPVFWRENVQVAD